MRKRWRLSLFVIIGLMAAFVVAVAGFADTSAPSSEDKKIEPDDQRGVAYHEAGHAVVSVYLLGADSVKDVVVFTATDDGSFGVTHMNARNQLSTADDYMREAAIFMGGRAADSVINGAPTNGAGSDLGHVNDVMWNKHLVSGLGDSLLVREKNEAPAAMRAKVEKDINDANACAEAIVRENRDAVVALGDALMSQQEIGDARKLTGDEARALLAQHPLKPLSPEAQAKVVSACSAPKVNVNRPH
jgi:cell division protease FtsH